MGYFNYDDHEIFVVRITETIFRIAADGERPYSASIEDAKNTDYMAVRGKNNSVCFNNVIYIPTKIIIEEMKKDPFVITRW